MITRVWPILEPSWFNKATFFFGHMESTLFNIRQKLVLIGYYTLLCWINMILQHRMQRKTLKDILEWIEKMFAVFLLQPLACKTVLTEFGE